MSDSLQVGSRFGPYLLKRLVGSGGMGSVFEAEDTILQRSVALKLISATYSKDPDYRMRLQREARIAGRLQDPHVVPVHSAGEIDGQLYVDMRLINGIDLDTMLRRSGPLPPARAVAVISQIASALDDAHAAGVLHRDVKPANILLTANDFAYLVDFGIANAAAESKLTQLGDVLGTWTYMAPERFSGNNSELTPSVDIYALACVLYECLTGSPPFTGDRVSVIGAHISQSPPRASVKCPVPSALDDVIARGMAKQPEHRYATAGDLARAAEAAIGTGAISVPTSPITEVMTAPIAPASAPTQAAAAMGPPGPTQAAGPPFGQTPYSSAPSPATPPNTHPGTGRKRWPLIAAAVVLVVAIAGGIGIWKLTAGGSKDDSTTGVDLSSLDVGRYGTEPRTLPGKTTEEEGRFLAAFRLAEGNVNPYDVDPKLTYLDGLAAPDPETAATAISGNATPIVQPVLAQYGMVSAYMVQGFSDSSEDFADAPDGLALIEMISSFPNPDAAARAADAMDATDFVVNPENQHATIPGYPQAKAHYQPGNASIAATMATAEFVVSIVLADKTATDISQLTNRVARILDLQMPLMKDLEPVVDVALTSLRLDPDNMLSRAFVAGEPPPIDNSYNTRGPRAVILCGGSVAVKEDILAQAGVDRCTRTPDAELLRARDDAAAKELLTKLTDADRGEGYVDHDIAPPNGIGDARCYERKQAIWEDNPNVRFGCRVAFGRYVAAVFSNEENDVHQRAAAQYAILVNGA